MSLALPSCPLKVCILWNSSPRTALLCCLHRHPVWNGWKGRRGLAVARQVGVDVGTQGQSHCRSVYLPSSRAEIMGREVECDGYWLKTPFLQKSSSSKKETATGGRCLWGATSPKAVGQTVSVHFAHGPVLELHLKLQISPYILKPHSELQLYEEGENVSVCISFDSNISWQRQLLSVLWASVVFIKN